MKPDGKGLIHAHHLAEHVRKRNSCRIAHWSVIQGKELLDHGINGRKGGLVLRMRCFLHDMY